VATITLVGSVNADMILGMERLREQWKRSLAANFRPVAAAKARTWPSPRGGPGLRYR